MCARERARFGRRDVRCAISGARPVRGGTAQRRAVSESESVGAGSKKTELVETKARRAFARPRGYWTDVQNVVVELHEFVEANGLAGRMPTIRELRAHGRGDLAGAIRRNGGWDALANKAELTPTAIAQPRSIYLTYTIELKRGTMKPHMYWRDFENLRAELEHLMLMRDDARQSTKRRNALLARAPDAHATAPFTSMASRHLRRRRQLPSTAQLEAAQRFDLIRAIQKHGGMEAVARRMDLRFRYHSRGYWAQLENVHRELRMLCSEFELGATLPSARLIATLGPPGLNTAIRAHGGRHAVARSLHVRTARRPRGFWRNLDNLCSELSAFVQDHAEMLRLPSSSASAVNDNRSSNNSNSAIMGNSSGSAVIDDSSGSAIMDDSSGSAIIDDSSDDRTGGALVGDRIGSAIFGDRSDDRTGSALVGDCTGSAIVGDRGGFPDLARARYRMPTKQELISAGRGDLAQAITRHSSMRILAHSLALHYSPEPWASHRPSSSSSPSS